MCGGFYYIKMSGKITMERLGKKIRVYLFVCFQNIIAFTQTKHIKNEKRINIINKISYSIDD
jgi:hypothetical protein